MKIAIRIRNWVNFYDIFIFLINFRIFLDYSGIFEDFPKMSDQFQEFSGFFQIFEGFSMKFQDFFEIFEIFFSFYSRFIRIFRIFDQFQDFSAVFQANFEEKWGFLTDFLFFLLVFERESCRITTIKLQFSAKEEDRPLFFALLL